MLEETFSFSQGLYVSCIINFSETPFPPPTRGVGGAIWFGFEHKSHPNREIKKHAVWFGSVDF